MFYKALEEVVLEIKKSRNYQECIRLKKQMNQNEQLMSIIAEIKKLQKQCVRNPGDGKVKTLLDEKTDELYQIPLYQVYMNYLEQVNQEISYVKDELNEYFTTVCNQFSL